MKRKAKRVRKFSKVFLDKVKMLAILLFILALFLLDVNLNVISFYGSEMVSPVKEGLTIKSTSLFWFGFIVMSISFFIVSIRSMYKKIRVNKLDLFFALLGVVGWGVILSGGLLIIAGVGGFGIPFFHLVLPRINYYHFGITLEILTIAYFALTK